MPRRLSQPPPDTGSLYPVSPTSRGTRASSVFPYSIARPPTNYMPRHGRRDTKGTDIEDEGETPMYARSDWDDDEPERGGVEGGPTAGTSWSRSSYAGAYTAQLTNATGFTAPLDQIREQDESPVMLDYGEVTQSPAPVTASSMATPLSARLRESPRSFKGFKCQSSFRSPRSARHRKRSGSRSTTSTYTAKPGHTDPFAPHSKELARRSTLPSVIELENLTGPLHLKTKNDNPFADPDPHALRQRAPYHPQETPAQGAFDPRSFSPSAGSMDLMTPAAQERLGRMSVAPARYSVSPQPSSSRKSKSRQSNDRGATPLSNLPGRLTPNLNPKNLSKWGSNTVIRGYLIWRPFINATLSLLCALLLTFTLQMSTSSVSRVMKVQPGVFNRSVGVGATVGLGVNGWCQITGTSPECRGYQLGDFATADNAFTLPGTPLLPALSYLSTALTSVTWLHATFSLATACLHIYLFFALSIPYSHLVDQTRSARQSKMGSSSHLDEKDPFRDDLDPQGKDLVQVEVDIMPQCERAPYAGYMWVWWAWWAHRRSPVGVIFALVTSIFALCTSAINIALYKQVVSATSSSGVSLAGDSLIPIATLILTIDPMASSLKWIVNAPKSWSTFLHPPDPSPAAIMLPPNSRQIQHIRPTTGRSSFYAAPRATLPPDLTIHEKEGEMDEETRRWLAAFPADQDLVPLIARIRGGHQEENFILSEVGLLYLKAEGDEPPLLVPPAGEIRWELLEDAHYPLVEPGGNEKTADRGHQGVEDMLAEMSETFWWLGMEEDIEEFVKHCEACARAKIDLKPGMTAVPFTGITDWTEPGKAGGRNVEESAMAAEMAYAMRKADEEADEDDLR